MDRLEEASASRDVEVPAEWARLLEQFANARNVGDDSVGLTATVAHQNHRLDVLSKDVVGLRSSVTLVQGQYTLLRDDVAAIHQMCEHFVVHTDDEVVPGQANGEQGLDESEEKWWSLEIRRQRPPRAAAATPRSRA